MPDRRLNGSRLYNKTINSTFRHIIIPRVYESYPCLVYQHFILLITFIGRFRWKMKCDHIHLFLILCLQFLRHTKHTHPHTYACCHARFHDSWPPFCLKVFIYAKLHELLCDGGRRRGRRRLTFQTMYVNNHYTVANPGGLGQIG